MVRITGVYRPSDYPGEPDEATRQDLKALFNYLRPGEADPEIDENHTGLALAALNPRLALHLAQLSRLLAVETYWGAHPALRELAIQAVNLHYRSSYSFRTRVPAASAAGIAEDLLREIPTWRQSSRFDEEQRLVLEYAHAVVASAVPAELLARATEAFGEKATVELTSIVGLWAFWAMLLNAAGAD